MQYRDYIKSEFWEERKRRYYLTHPHVCEVCGHPDVDLHHLVYGDYGNERDKNLAALCRVHHEELHQMVKLRKNMFYQSRYAVEEMKVAWEDRRNFVVEPVPHASSTSFEERLHAIAVRIQRPFKRFF